MSEYQNNPLFDKLEISELNETALLTLYARALESQSEDPILKDEMSEKLVRTLDPFIRMRDSKMARQLAKNAVDPRVSVHLTLRAKKYDEYVQDFLLKNPYGTVINLGCGLDTRFYRLDNGTLEFFDVDLPEIIELKRKLINEQDRYSMIGQSVLDFRWLDRIARSDRKVIILAEGLFMYLPREGVQGLVLKLQQRFPGAELICELTGRTWVEGFWGKLAAIKMQKQLKMGGGAKFVFGVSNPQELETWGQGIEFLEKWFYMDENHPKLGWLRIFKNWQIFRNVQYTVRYRLN
jgi:methyltransferase (TIGR00027 family)